MAQDCTIDKIIRGLSDLESQLKVYTPSEKATVNNNEQTSVTPIEEKRPSWSWWDRVRERVKKIGKVKKEVSNHGSDSEGRNIGKDQEDLDLEIQKLQSDLEIQKLQSDIRQMKAAFENLTKFQNKMSKRLEPFHTSNNLEAILKKADSFRSRSDDLKEIRKKISALKYEIPSLLYKQSSRVLSTTDSQTEEENRQIIGSDINLPGLHASSHFKFSVAFEEVAEIFLSLDDIQKQQCLLSFAVFPENREVKRTMLMYWWIGEGFINCDAPEKSVKSILDDFSKKGLLEAVEDERKLEPSSYKMEPHVHSAVIHLAEYIKLFELYSKEEGKLTLTRSSKEKVCLVKDSSLDRKAITSVMKPAKSLKTIFNSSERYPDFTFKWFREMESLRVLYLGRWERTAKRHIEVESTDFIKNMKNLKNLKLASFQGISRIEKLDKLVCALPKLVILDLRACYNLEVLPDDIGSLESLIYLDVSECYMLDRMPRGIANLSNLQVLKGFVISPTDVKQNFAVKHLFNLRKLSITVNKTSFTVENLIKELKDLKKLESLKIAWGALQDETEDKDNVLMKAHTREEKKGDGEDGKKLSGSLKTDNVVEGEKKTSLSQESTKTSQKKPEDQKGKRKVEKEGDGDKGKADQEEGKKHDEVKAESSKSEKEASPSRETIQNKQDDQKGKSNVEGDGDKGKVDLKEGKKQDVGQGETSKTEKVVEGEKKAISSQEVPDTIQKNQDDKSQEGGGDKGKAGPVEGNKQNEVKGESSKTDNGVEGIKKTSPSGESKDAIQKKLDDTGKEEKEEDGDGDKGEGKKRDEVEAEKSKSDNGVEGVKKTSPSRESTDAIHKKQPEEQGDGEKKKVNLEEGKKKDEVKAESSKPQVSKDTIQSKLDDHNENGKVQEKKDGEKSEADLKKLNEGEENTQKSEKTNKFGKKVSFSEEPALIQKKLDDPKRDDNAKEKEIHETSSSSKSEKIDPKECLWSMVKGRPKKQERRHQTTTIETSMLPTSLKKLELECFPDTDPPSWLLPKNLVKLEKLSIKGGKLSNLVKLEKLSIKGGKLSKISDGPLNAEINNCGVQVLRLKYLHEFKAEWKDLKELFPKMKLFEKFKCPKVGFCPTDGYGVWRSQTQASPDRP